MMISNLSQMEKKREHIYNTTETKRDGRTILCEKNKRTDSCCLLLFQPSVFSSIRVFSNESALRIRWQSIGTSASATILSNEYSGLIFMAQIENGNTDMASQGRWMRQFVAEDDELKDCHTLNPIYRHHLYMLLYMFIYVYICTYIHVYMWICIWLCMYILQYDLLIYSSVDGHKFELFPICIVMNKAAMHVFMVINMAKCFNRKYIYYS